MKVIQCWNDLQPFGIVLLTGESCGLMYRILFDLTEQGKKVVEKCLGCKLDLADAWNPGSKDDPHVGSILFSREMLIPIGIFALLESGCTEVWLSKDRLFGVEPRDDKDSLERLKKREDGMRRFAYQGTAGDRNVHVFTGRTE